MIHKVGRGHRYFYNINSYVCVRECIYADARVYIVVTGELKAHSGNRRRKASEGMWKPNRLLLRYYF